MYHLTDLFVYDFLFTFLLVIKIVFNYQECYMEQILEGSSIVYNGGCKPNNVSKVSMV